MQLHVKGKNLEVNESIRRYAERKLHKLDRQLSDSARVEVELAVERNPSIAESQVAEATVHVKGRTLRARKEARDMRAAIDVRQVKDVRDKRVSRRRRGEPEPAVDDAVEAGITES
jgi:ribosomal subunit interface protein